VAVVDRIAQGASGLFPRLPAERDAILAETLSTAQRDAFLTLPVYDQRHLCATYRYLRNKGIANTELLQAALLHDLGKAALGGRVTLLDRTLNVLVGTFAPALLDRLARLPAPRWRTGLALAVHHPRLGAEWAAELGCSARTCWLIAHHADDPPPDGDDLAQLILADKAV
jgi:hypothetical protein